METSPTPALKQQNKKVRSNNLLSPLDTDLFQKKPTIVIQTPVKTQPSAKAKTPYPVKIAGVLIQNVAPKKTGTALQPFIPMTYREHEEMCKKFYEEPTQEDFGDIFGAGIADKDMFKYPEEPDSVRISMIGVSFFLSFYYPTNICTYRWEIHADVHALHT